MTIEEYYRWLEGLGFKPTGEGTNITMEFSDGQRILWVTRPEELSDTDRAAAIERCRMYLGIDYPRGPRVH